MPELPEVETTRRGIEPLVVGRTIVGVTLRTRKLRWPVDPGLDALLAGKTIVAVRRRAKYLLLQCGEGHLILHLGMSGHLCVVAAVARAGRHDHLDLRLDDGSALRLTDPRRFGAVIWTEGDPLRHPLLAELGPEPFDVGFDGPWLLRRARGRRVAVKAFLMDQRIVVGVGNIYASEALFRAGIDPRRPAGNISGRRYGRLAEAVRAVLSEAIEAGGTTLRDFARADGRPGYFGLRLAVYGRGGEPCPRCGRPLACERVGQRSSYFCRGCQR